jgi:hypothetical protein
MKNKVTSSYGTTAVKNFFRPNAVIPFMRKKKKNLGLMG